VRPHGMLTASLNYNTDKTTKELKTNPHTSTTTFSFGHGWDVSWRGELRLWQHW
jgi:hypothetical protein